MITESTIYWITRLNSILAILGVAGSLLVIAGAILTVCWHANWYRDGDREIFRKRVKHPMLPIIAGFCMLISMAFVPTTKQMCIIKVLPMIVNNEQVQQLPNKVVELANDWLDELKPDHKK
jgi:hypothetical protein